MRKMILTVALVLAWVGIAFGENDFDFRKSHWGDSLAQVKKSEKGNEVFIKDKNRIGYVINSYDKTGYALYIFEKNKLVSGTVGIEVNSPTELNLIFNRLKEELNNKYHQKNNPLISEQDKTNKENASLKYMQEHSAFFYNEKTEIILNGIVLEFPSTMTIVYYEKEYAKKIKNKNYN